MACRVDNSRIRAIWRAPGACARPSGARLTSGAPAARDICAGRPLAAHADAQICKYKTDGGQVPRTETERELHARVNKTHRCFISRQRHKLHNYT